MISAITVSAFVFSLLLLFHKLIETLLSLYPSSTLQCMDLTVERAIDIAQDVSTAALGTEGSTLVGFLPTTDRDPPDSDDSDSKDVYEGDPAFELLHRFADVLDNFNANSRTLAALKSDNSGIVKHPAVSTDAQ